MRYEDKEGGRPKETEKENEKKRKTWWYREEGDGELDEKKTAGRDGKTYRKKREKETRERQKRETERAVKSEFGRNE